MSLINSDNMATYPTLIAEACGTEKTTINVSKAIPVPDRDVLQEGRTFWMGLNVGVREVCAGTHKI